MEGVSVLDYAGVFQQTDLAKERFEEQFESSDFKDLRDEGIEKENERNKLLEKFNKDESTLSQKEKDEILKKIQTLGQSIQLVSQQLQTQRQELIQRLQSEQVEVVRKVVNELIKAKKIKLLINSQAILSIDDTDKNLNITPEVIELVNKEQKK